MVSIPLLALRGVQIFLTILITALVGNAIHEAAGGNPSEVNYAIFVAVFCWLVLIYTTVAGVLDSIAVPMAVMVLDALAALFTFIAGVVLAAGLGVHSCGNEAYTLTNKLTAGSFDTSKRCHELQASTAFFWFLFASFLATCALTVVGGGLSGGVGGGRGGLRKGGPSMSQV